MGVLSSPRGPFRNYRRKSTDLKMSWSTKRRNSRPSLTNSTRPSPRCPATKKIFYHPTNFPNFFPSQISFFRDFLPPSKSRNFAATTFLYVFPPPKTFKKKTKSFSSVTVVFGCDDIFLCEKLILRAFLTNSQLLNF